MAQNGVDISRMKKGRLHGGLEKLQRTLTDLTTEYDDIFSYSVKGRRGIHNRFKKNCESSGNRMDRSQLNNWSLSRH